MLRWDGPFNCMWIEQQKRRACDDITDVNRFYTFGIKNRRSNRENDMASLDTNVKPR